MSQSPYTPPNVSGYYASGFPYAIHDPFAQLRRPARFSGIGMIAYGALVLLCSLDMGIKSQMPKSEMYKQMPADQIQILEQYEKTAGVGLNGVALGMAIAVLIVGIVVIGFGIMARKGETGWLVASLCAMIPNALISGLFLLATLVLQPMGACLMLPAAALAVGAVVGLILALRNNGRIREMQRQMQMQMYAQQQYEQQQMQRIGPWGQPPNPPGNPPAQ